MLSVWYKQIEKEKNKKNTESKDNTSINNKLTDEEEIAFQKFFKTLPLNLRIDSPEYNIRGYWNALNRPLEFDYSQPKEADGEYHAFSRNPETGEILKAPFHPTFKSAIEKDRKIGYYPIVTPEGTIKTVSGKDYFPEKELSIGLSKDVIKRISKKYTINK
jgi:hypothetical protein